MNWQNSKEKRQVYIHSVLLIQFQKYSLIIFFTESTRISRKYRMGIDSDNICE